MLAMGHDTDCSPTQQKGLNTVQLLALVKSCIGQMISHLSWMMILMR